MQTTFTQTNGANSDVIECLANLSSNEVFTPPAVVASMLDLLPQSLFTDPNTTILDPAVKSGIFLREAAKRFIKGEEVAIPDLKERVEHIMRCQLFGIALTELTALTGRRTLYCSAHAAEKYSVCHFPTDDGNIRYTQTEHTFKSGKCIYCGAAEAAWGQSARGGREAHAYEFIHKDSVECRVKSVEKEEDDMHFDVVVGNPPYQMGDGGAFASASLIYQHFVEAAKALIPRYISMIMPARWYARVEIVISGKWLVESKKNLAANR